MRSIWVCFESKGLSPRLYKVQFCKWKLSLLFHFFSLPLQSSTFFMLPKPLSITATKSTEMNTQKNKIKREKPEQVASTKNERLIFLRGFRPPSLPEVVWPETWNALTTLFSFSFFVCFYGAFFSFSLFSNLMLRQQWQGFFNQ